ncbi:hypothetical protein RCH17_002716 [Arthrobacter sp. MP_M7]|nr:hypothetical protein [Arthrobacter sp. MP_M7]
MRALYVFTVSGDLPAACLSAGGSCCGHAGPGAFGELVSFKLGKGRNDGDQGLGGRSPDLTVWVSGDAVPQRAEVDAAGLEVIEQLQQVASVAPEPVQLPHKTSSPRPRRSNIRSSSGRLILVPLTPWSV